MFGHAQANTQATFPETDDWLTTGMVAVEVINRFAKLKAYPTPSGQRRRPMQTNKAHELRYRAEGWRTVAARIVVPIHKRPVPSVIWLLGWTAKYLCWKSMMPPLALGK